MRPVVIFTNTTYTNPRKPSLNHPLKNLARLNRWAKQWGIAFNVAKCCFITVGKTADKETVSFEYKLERTMWKWVDHFKYLDVSISNTFDWGKPIKVECLEALQTLGLLRRTIKTAPEKVAPKLEYAAEVWNQFQIGHMEKLSLFRTAQCVS